MDNFLPIRQNPRLAGYDYCLPGSYFITVCITDRYHLLGDVIDTPNAMPYIKLSDIGIAVENSIHQIPVLNPGGCIDAYCIMPDHIHMIVTLREQYSGRSIPDIIGRFKSYTDHIFRVTAGFNLWQRSYYDHIIRNQADFNAIVDYINQNPIRWTEKNRSIPL